MNTIQARLSHVYAKPGVDSAPPRLAAPAARAGGQSYVVSQIRSRTGALTVSRMPEFLAETYTPRGVLGGAAVPRADDLARAAAQASAPGAAVRFLGAILVPAEEICFWLYQAPAAEAVRAAMTAAGLNPERITPAVTIRPPRPARPGGGPPAAGLPPPARTP